MRGRYSIPLTIALRHVPPVHLQSYRVPKGASHCILFAAFTQTAMAAVQAVLSALDVFSRAPDKAALDQANTWLQDFQHSVNTSRLSYGLGRDV